MPKKFQPRSRPYGPSRSGYGSLGNLLQVVYKASLNRGYEWFRYIGHKVTVRLVTVERWEPEPVTKMHYQVTLKDGRQVEMAA